MKPEFDFLYVNGDSFSSGHNLANKYLYPKSSIFKQEFCYEDSRTEKFIKKAEKIIEKNRLDYSTIITAEKSAAFASKVAKKTGIDFLNSSNRGSSLQEICFSTILDFERLKKQRNIKNCFAVIMLTSITRNIIPVENSATNNCFASILPSSPKNTNSQEIKKISDYFYRTASQEYHELSAIIALNGLKNYFYENDINFAFFDSFMYSESILETELDRTNFITPDEVIKNWYNSDEKILLFCGHFNEKVHEDIADIIIKKYLKEEPY
jgi:hypothetical protein